jgi:ABC-2 type transport system ATP-binding protein
MVAIAFENVTKRFGRVEALRGVTLSVQEGTVHGCLGSNGAGKTTSVRVMLGLLPLDEGRVRVLNLDPSAEGTKVRAQCGAVLDHDGLYDRISVRDNLLFHLRLHGLGKEAASNFERVLAELDFTTDLGVRISTLSRGNRQKVALARAFLHAPRLLVLDEPFIGLDPIAATKFRTLLRAKAARDGTTVFVTTHDLGQVERLCDNVSIVHQGRVIRSGSLDEIRGSESLEDAFVRAVASHA